MSLIVWTGRRPTRHFAGYRETDALDISRETGDDIGATFAPAAVTLSTWTNAKGRARRAGIKHGDAERLEAELQAAFDAFARAYLLEMRVSYRRHRSDWDALLSHDLVTLCSYEATVQRSHRRLLAELLVRCGATYRGER